MNGSRAWLACVCPIACMLAPGPTEGQSPFFLRLAPDVSRVTVEHTKEVTIGDGASSRTSSSNGLGAAAILSGGASAAAATWRICCSGRGGRARNSPPAAPTRKPVSRAHAATRTSEAGIVIPRSRLPVARSYAVVQTCRSIDSSGSTLAKSRSTFRSRFPRAPFRSSSCTSGHQQASPLRSALSTRARTFGSVSSRPDPPPPPKTAPPPPASRRPSSRPLPRAAP